MKRGIFPILLLFATPISWILMGLAGTVGAWVLAKTAMPLLVAGVCLITGVYMLKVVLTTNSEQSTFKFASLAVAIGFMILGLSFLSGMIRVPALDVTGVASQQGELVHTNFLAVTSVEPIEAKAPWFTYVLAILTVATFIITIIDRVKYRKKKRRK